MGLLIKGSFSAGDVSEIRQLITSQIFTNDQKLKTETHEGIKEVITKENEMLKSILSKLGYENLETSNT